MKGRSTGPGGLYNNPWSLLSRRRWNENKERPSFRWEGWDSSSRAPAKEGHSKERGPLFSALPGPWLLRVPGGQGSDRHAAALAPGLQLAGAEGSHRWGVQAAAGPPSLLPPQGALGVPVLVGPTAGPATPPSGLRWQLHFTVARPRVPRPLWRWPLPTLVKITLFKKFLSVRRLAARFRIPAGTSADHGHQTSEPDVQPEPRGRVKGVGGGVNPRPLGLGVEGASVWVLPTL